MMHECDVTPLQVSIERRGPPYTTCYPIDESHAELDVYEEHYKVKYSNLVRTTTTRATWYVYNDQS